MNDKIAELRARVAADPKSRHFYPLGEELRKAGSLEEAEGVLREGLANHPNYLSAWISLGRVLRDEKKHREAIDILQRAFTLDGSNVVTARLMAESYRELGDHVEAIKKFKLVRALLPPDQTIEDEIAALEREIGGEVSAPPPPPSSPAVSEDGPAVSGGSPSMFALESPIEQDGAEPAEGSESIESQEHEPPVHEPPAGDVEAAGTAGESGPSPEPAGESPGGESEPFDIFGDDTLVKARGERREDDPFGLEGGEPAGQSQDDVFGMPDEDPEREVSQPAAAPPAYDEVADSAGGARYVADAPHADSSDQAPDTSEAPAAASDGRAERLSSWLGRVRRNSGVS